MNIGIYGYGNLGRAAELCAIDRSDIHIVSVFTRRSPYKVQTFGAPIYGRERICDFVGKIDCMLMCGGSYDDLRTDTPCLAEHFNTVDSFDIHREAAMHRSLVNAVAASHSHTSIVSVGWDPGLLSIFRLYSKAIFPDGVVNTFWGRGVSQGHSEVIRRISGVKHAVQYTVPIQEARELARNGISLGDDRRHRRECYVVAESGAEESIAAQIKAIPDYFSGYETDVHFISEEEYLREHASMPHRGEAISFSTGGIYKEHVTRASLTLEMDSNPELTASVLLAYAEACVKLHREEKYGAYTPFDIAPAYLLDSDPISIL